MSIIIWYILYFEKDEKLLQFLLLENEGVKNVPSGHDDFYRSCCHWFFYLIKGEHDLPVGDIDFKPIVLRVEFYSYP